MNYPNFHPSLRSIAERIHSANKAKGFWDNERNMGEMLMLVVSELSEALEEDRAGRPVYYLDGVLKPGGLAVELVDAIIRCLDILGWLEIDVDGLLEEKLAYNASRPHKHGKAY